MSLKGSNGEDTESRKLIFSTYCASNSTMAYIGNKCLMEKLM
jgi:hypothetical protein